MLRARPEHAPSTLLPPNRARAPVPVSNAGMGFFDVFANNVLVKRLRGQMLPKKLY